jgi:hypothetical protein
MTSHNSRDTINGRNESSNRTANTVGTPSKAGMLAKVVVVVGNSMQGSHLQQRDTINTRDDSSTRDNRHIIDVSSSRAATPTKVAGTRK